MRRSFVVTTLACCAFGLGCGVGMTAGHLLVPPANAQQASQLLRYEYHCVPIIRGMSSMDASEIMAYANKLGDQAWEMSTMVGASLCFRRQKL